MKPCPGSVTPGDASECPLNASVEMLGDRWSLLIIRDMMLRGVAAPIRNSWSATKALRRTFWPIACANCIAYGILAAEPDPTDGRKVIYSVDCERNRPSAGAHRNGALGGRHENTGNQALVRQMHEDKEKFLAGVRQRWAGQNRSTAPFPTDRSPPRLDHHSPRITWFGAESGSQTG